MTLSVWRRSACSFVAPDICTLVTWLREQGYADRPIRQPTEYARLERDGALIVCYHSGAAVCQGREQQTATALLLTLPQAGVEAVARRWSDEHAA